MWGRSSAGPALLPPVEQCMEITKDLFEQRRAQFAQEREKLLQLLGGTAQGIAECDYWLAKLAESERPAEPAKE